MLKLLPDDAKELYTARILLYKLFYDQTDQGMTQFLLNLIKTFDTHKQPKRFSPFKLTTQNDWFVYLSYPVLVFQYQKIEVGRLMGG